MPEPATTTPADSPAAAEAPPPTTAPVTRAAGAPGTGPPASPAAPPASASTVRFAEAARRLSEACRARGLIAPAFRSPPGRPSVRTLRRRPDGGVVVAVQVRGRPLAVVLADMVDGVVAANHLSGAEAEQVRQVLLAA